MYVMTQMGYTWPQRSHGHRHSGVRECGDGGIYVRIDGKVLQWIEKQGIHVFIARSDPEVY